MNARCFHCDEPIDTRDRICARIGERDEPVCCHGCAAVAELIAGAGLQDYYRFRQTPAARASMDDAATEWSAFDQPRLVAELTQAQPDGTRTAQLLLDNVSCAACGWLIERMLLRIHGIAGARVNVASARLRVAFDPARISFAQVLARLSQLGYRPHPVTSSAGAERAREERRSALQRLWIAGIGMMQVMMFAVAFYSSDMGAPAAAMDADTRALLRWVSLLCATPVMWYSGWPFLTNAARAMRARGITMDVPVSIGLLLAYVASIVNTVRNSGEVYFDSVTMFVFFLALGRFVEMTARHQTSDVTDALARLLPLTAHRVRSDGGGAESIDDVAVTALRVGDVLVVRGGETVPADGAIVAGESRLDESLLTGEALPVLRGVGAKVTAGTINMYAPLRVDVTAIGQATVLSGIVRLLQRTDHTTQPSSADRAARWFLSRILAATALVGGVWLFVDPSRAFEATLAMLVVTCPCALSLATPTALAAATAALARRGVLITQAAALEVLSKATRVIFDKTGTLTHGQLIIERCHLLSAVSADSCRRIAAALEQGSEHPIARAFQFAVDGDSVATDVQVTPGGGIEGTVDGARYRIGRRHFVRELCATLPAVEEDAHIYLGSTDGELAWFELSDRLRGDARDVIARIQARRLPCEILSGDAWVTVAHTAQLCGIDTYTARQSPADKLDYVREQAARGEIVAMVGDGINDAPVLKGAAVSIAMGQASALAQASADIVLVGDKLSALPEAIDIARRTARIVKQNLAWATAYNVVALPLAALGFVPPWLAAVGMSASSMLVVFNALRLRSRDRDAQRAQRDASLAQRIATPYTVA